MKDRLRGIILLFLCLFLLPVPASAQTAYNATLSLPYLDTFPQIGAFLDVHDEQGKFIHGLEDSQIRILEDGIPLPVEEISERRSGVQVVVAINPGPSLGIRNPQGISRYDFIKGNLEQWATGRLGTTLDDMSLLITGGPEISHVSDPASWLTTLKTDQVNPRAAIPNLDTLFRAVSLAADSSPRQGMGRAVLFITPPPDGQQSQSLENLIAQAKQQGVSIYIWMVSSVGTFTTIGVKRLTELSAQTGGKIFTYSGEELLPNPEEYFEPLRYIYWVKYKSQIKNSGAHQVAVQIRIDNEPFETNVQSFETDIRSPQPAFISPPIKIQRKPAADIRDQQGDQASLPAFEPREQVIQVIFDFPDGRKRAIVQSLLSVDGVTVARNDSPPFDQFVWNLENYVTDGTHVLQIQITDVLGLTGTSIELPVQITIEHRKLNPWAIIQRNLPLLTALVVLVAGAILLLVLVLGGRLRPGTQKAASGVAHNHRKTDPVTQPVPVQSEPFTSHLPNWVNRLQWPQRHVAPKASAYLSRISDTDELSTSPPIPITSDEITLGCDPNLATLVLDDPSIEALHARLVRNEDGNYRLADEGSIAGTWINYAPVSQSGTNLEHGDLIHIGHLGFRFTLRQPVKVRKPVVTLQSPPKEPSEEENS